MTFTADRRVRLVTVAIGVVGLIALAVTPAAAQDISVNFGQGGANSGLTERVIQMIALLTVLSLAPSILVMMTSFRPGLSTETGAVHKSWDNVR